MATGGRPATTTAATHVSEVASVQTQREARVRNAGATTVRATLFGAYRRLGLLENFTGYLLDPVAGDRRDQRQ